MFAGAAVDEVGEGVEDGEAGSVEPGCTALVIWELGWCVFIAAYWMDGGGGGHRVGSYVPSDIFHGQARRLNAQVKQALDAILERFAKPSSIVVAQQRPFTDLLRRGRDKEIRIRAEEDTRGSGSELENQVWGCVGTGGAEAAAGGGEFFEVFDVGKVVGNEGEDLGGER